MLWVSSFIARRVAPIALFIAAAFSTVLLVTPVNAQQHSQESLIEALQQGGLVIYLRHAATHKDQIDQRPIDLADCTKQRNLSAQGQQQAERIGSAFKQLNIPVAEVISSPFCRCKETAQLAFQKATTNDNLFFSIGLPKTERDDKTVALQTLLSLPVQQGNRVIVSHTSNLKEAAGIWPKTEGGAYLFKPEGDQQFTFLGKILPSDWEQLK